MKRIGNLFHRICSLENLQLADSNARKGKMTVSKKRKSRRTRYEINEHDKNREANIITLRESLLNKTYRTSAYSTFEIFEPKKRFVSRLPYYPDRIVHHAIVQILEPIFYSVFTADTYSCIKGKGIHSGVKAIKKVLQDAPGTQYCLKLDITKFYPSVDHDILKQLLRRKFKDADLLWLLDEIIDSSPGLPIGNYLSQYFANFYLTYFDHWIKEVKGVKYYFRYADDIVIPASTKEELHQLLADIRTYLSDILNLSIKANYQVFPVAARGIDVLGYVIYHTHIKIRKRIKKNFVRMAKVNKNQQSIASYNGLIKHCNGRHLFKKILRNAA